jgi:hypothetical protein
MAEQTPAKWEALRQRAADPNAAAFVNPTSGAIEVFNRADLGESQAKALEARGLKPAAAEDIEKRATHLEAAEHQTRAAIELGLNTATAGAIGKEDFGRGAEARREALETESPLVAMGARVVGGAVPLALTAGLGTAAGLGRAALGAAEGVGVGLAEESAQAAWENRDLSAGNVALAGLGGALFSSAIPAVIRRGGKALAKADDAVAAAAGDVAENMGPRLEAQAAKRASQRIGDVPPGPARDELLRQGAKTHLDRVKAEVSDVATRAGEAMGKADLDTRTLKRLMPKDAPVQTKWATETAEALRKAATREVPGGKVVSDEVAALSAAFGEATGAKVASRAVEDTAHAGALRAAADSLLEAKGGFDTMQRARTAMVELRRAGAPDEVIESIRKGVTDQSLFGRAAEAVGDFEASAARAPKSPLDGFDPENLTQASKSQLESLAASLEDRAAARAKWDVGGAKDAQSKRLLADAKRIRAAAALADDVAGARSRQAMSGAANDVAPQAAPAAAAPKSPWDGLKDDLASEGVEYLAERALGAVVPGAGLAMKLGRRLWSSVDASGRESIRQAARSAARGAMRGIEATSTGSGRVLPSALQTFAADFPGPQEAFAARRGMLETMMRDPTVLPNALAESFGDLPRQNPKLFAQVAARMARATAYVTANLPVGIATTITHPRGVQPSRDTLRDFAVVWNSAMHPETVIDSVEDGSASPEQMRALATVDPDAYATLKADVTAEVADSYEQTTAQTKQWLDILFQSDGIAGPAYSWKAADIMAAGEAKTGQSMQMGAMPAPSKQAPQSRGISNIQNGVTNRGA